jgi:hypothetical protein
VFCDKYALEHYLNITIKLEYTYIEFGCICGLALIGKYSNSLEMSEIIRRNKSRLEVFFKTITHILAINLVEKLK